MVSQVATLGVTIETASAKAALGLFNQMVGSAQRLEQRVDSVTAKFRTQTTVLRGLGNEMARTSAWAATLGARMDGIRGVLAGMGLTTATNRMKSLGTASANTGRNLQAIGTGATGTSSRLQAMGANAATATSSLQTMGTSGNRARSAIASVGPAAQTSMRQVSSSTIAAKGHVEGFMSVVLRLALIFGGLQAAVAGVGVIANFEDMHSTLTQLHRGDALAGSRDLELARSMARTSPQTTEEVVKAIISMRNAGVEPTRELLTMFADVANSTIYPQQAYQAVTKIFGPRGQGGGLGVEELEILQTSGIDVYGAINRQLGLGRLEVGKLGQTAEGARQILEALRKEFTLLYSGATARRIDNLSTKMNAFVDVLKGAALEIGKGLGRSLKDSIDAVAGFVSNNKEALQQVGVAISLFLKMVITLTGALLTLNEAMGGVPFKLAAWVAFLFVLRGVWKVMGLIFAFGTVGRAGVAFAWFYNLWTTAGRTATIAAATATWTGFASAIRSVGPASAAAAAGLAGLGAGGAAGGAGARAVGSGVAAGVGAAAGARAVFPTARSSTIPSERTGGRLGTMWQNFKSAIGRVFAPVTRSMPGWMSRIIGVIGGVGGRLAAFFGPVGLILSISLTVAAIYNYLTGKSGLIGGGGDGEFTPPPPEPRTFQTRGGSTVNLDQFMTTGVQGYIEGRALEANLAAEQRAEERERFREMRLEYIREMRKEEASIKEFRTVVDERFTPAIRGLVTGTEEGKNAVKTMVKELGNDLEQRVLESAIGRPFRELMANILEDVYDALISRTWGHGGNFFTWISGAGAIAGEPIPSFHGGGFTGSGARVGGVDGRGGMPAIVHPNETVIDHMKGGIVVQPKVTVVNKNGSMVKSRPSGDGKALEITVDNAVAGALARGKNTNRVMRQVFGQDRQSRGV